MTLFAVAYFGLSSAAKAYDDQLVPFISERLGVYVVIEHGHEEAYYPRFLVLRDQEEKLGSISAFDNLRQHSFFKTHPVPSEVQRFLGEEFLLSGNLSGRRHSVKILLFPNAQDLQPAIFIFDSSIETEEIFKKFKDGEFHPRYEYSKRSSIRYDFRESKKTISQGEVEALGTAMYHSHHEDGRELLEALDKASQEVRRCSLALACLQRIKNAERNLKVVAPTNLHALRTRRLGG
jgi:hypothetical protein